MAKANAEVKAGTNKISTQKTARKARGEGSQVSLTVDAKVWKVLHAVSKLQGTRVSVLLAQSLEPIMSHAGVTIEEVDRFLRGTQGPPPSKEARSEVLDRLFGSGQTG